MKQTLKLLLPAFFAATSAVAPAVATDRVIFKPVPGEGVSVGIKAPVGTLHFSCEQQELPHVFEHYLMEGGAEVGVMGVISQFRDWGGSAVAETTLLETYYQFTFHRDYQHEAVSLIANLYGRALSHLEEAAWNKAVHTVNLEAKTHGADLATLSRVFDHPRLSCGHVSTDALTLETGHNFKEAHYNPENIELIVAGDLTVDQLAIIAEQIGVRHTGIQPKPILDQATLNPAQISKGDDYQLGQTNSLLVTLPVGELVETRTGQVLIDMVERSWIAYWRDSVGVSYSPSMKVEYLGPYSVIRLRADMGAGDLIRYDWRGALQSVRFDDIDERRLQLKLGDEVSGNQLMKTMSRLRVGFEEDRINAKQLEIAWSDIVKHSASTKRFSTATLFWLVLVLGGCWLLVTGLSKRRTPTKGDLA